MLEVPMVRVKSSALFSVGHSLGTLHVRFHTDACPARKGQDCACDGHSDLWKYPDVQPEEHAGLMAASSVGKHFAQLIRGRKFEKVVPKKED